MSVDRDLDSGRREARRAHPQRPARHRRRLVDPRHDRHRRALFLRRLDPLDPSRHRRGARPRPRPCRGRDRLDLRGRHPQAARSPRGGAHRHGRFRRRHAEIYAPPPGAQGDGRGRLRQDDEARPGPARPAFAARRRRSRLARRAVSREAGGDATLAERVRGANTALEALELARAAGIDLGAAVAEAAWATAAKALRDPEDRARDRGLRSARARSSRGRLSGRLTADLLFRPSGSGGGNRDRRARSRGNPRRRAPGRRGSTPCAPSALPP